MCVYVWQLYANASDFNEIYSIVVHFHITLHIIIYYTIRMRYEVCIQHIDYIWVVNCNCKCNYVSYCSFCGVDRSHRFSRFLFHILKASQIITVLPVSQCVCIWKYHTIKRPSAHEKKTTRMHFISLHYKCECMLMRWTILTKTNLVCLFWCLTLLEYGVSGQKRNQIVIITNKQFWGAVFRLN